MMDKLKNTTKIVKEILQAYPDTRNSDNLLYIKVCEILNSAALNKPFWIVLANLKDWDLPGFETVRRARQKLQATYPELTERKSSSAQAAMALYSLAESRRGTCFF